MTNKIFGLTIIITTAMLFFGFQNHIALGINLILGIILLIFK